MIRQFYLVNDEDEIYFFNLNNQTLISKIDDLGFSKENTYVSFDKEKRLISSKDELGEVGFNLVFLNGYKGYTDFIKFIRKSNELKLYYQLEYNLKYCKVWIKSITKTELEGAALECKIILDRLSLWIVKETYNITVNEDLNGKVYPYKYSYVYSASYNGMINLSNDGENRAPLIISIVGSVNNPMVELIKDGKVVSTLRILIEHDNCEIEVSSVPSDQHLTLKTEENVENIYQYQDFTCDNFIVLDRGDYIIKFTPGVSFPTQCKVVLIKEYAGV